KMARAKADRVFIPALCPFVERTRTASILSPDLHYKILFLGDVVGKPGRTAVKEGLPSLLDTHQPLFTIINGENSAGGVGITPDIADELFNQGADAITLGNHAFNKREIMPYLETGRP